MQLYITVFWGSNCNFVTVSVKTTGRRSKMWLTWSTTPSSRQSSASPSVLTTLAKWVVLLGGKAWHSQTLHILGSPAGWCSSLRLSGVWFQVILTGDVSEIGGFRLFRSQDFGLTFIPSDLPFEPLIQMLYNPGDCNTLLTLSITVAAFTPQSKTQTNKQKPALFLESSFY